MHSYMRRSADTGTFDYSQHQHQGGNTYTYDHQQQQQEEMESPQRLHHPTPLLPAHRFEQVLPSREESADFNQLDNQQQQQNYSTSLQSESSGMTLAAVAAAAAAADTMYVQNYQQTQSQSQNQNQYQEPTSEGMASPTMTEMEHPSPGTKRLFIHPFGHGQVAPPPPTAPASLSAETQAPPASATASAVPSASSSAGTFSTHNPPTPGSAPPSMLDFAMAAKTTAGATRAGAFANYVPQAQSQTQFQHATPAPASASSHVPAPQPLSIPSHHHQQQQDAQQQQHQQQQQQQYHYPPQTAPLPLRSSSFEEAPIPPASAHTNLHYAQFQASAALAAAAEHHSSYPGAAAASSASQLQPQLPPPGAFSFSSAFPNSPFHTRTFPPVNNTNEYTGYVHPLPPIRGFASHRASATSPIAESPHQLISPLPTHMHVGIHGHPPIYGPGMVTPLTRPMNLDEEVKNIEAHSGATSFVSKLWFLLSQPQEFGEYIRWTVKGKAFILSHNSPTFGEVILSRFFRHSNIASFIRQLNLYKMQRMSQLALLEDLSDSGGRVDGELTHTGFSHPHLQRGHPELLHMIKPQCGRKRTKKEIKAAEALEEHSPPLSPGRKTRTASSSTSSTFSR